MFIAVVSGYIMAAVMAFCGLYGILSFLQGDLKNLGAYGFVYGIAVASWPLVAGIALFALIQSIILLEKLVIYITLNPSGAVAAAPPKANKEPVHRRNMSLSQITRSFFHIEPSSIPRTVADGMVTPPAPVPVESVPPLVPEGNDHPLVPEDNYSSLVPEDAEAETMELDSITELAQKTDSERILTEFYPDGNTQADTTAGDVQAAPQEPAQNKRPGDGLSFFRVD